MIFGFWKRIFTEFLKIVLNIVLLDEIKCLFLSESFCNFFDRMIDKAKEYNIYNTSNDQEVSM